MIESIIIPSIDHFKIKKSPLDLPFKKSPANMCFTFSVPWVYFLIQVQLYYVYRKNTNGINFVSSLVF